MTAAPGTVRDAWSVPLPPDEVADIVVSGMRSGRFYILTSENRNDAVTRRGTEIVSGGPPAAPFP